MQNEKNNNDQIWNIPDESYGEIGQKGGEVLNQQKENVQEKVGMDNFEQGIKGGTSQNNLNNFDEYPDIGGDNSHIEGLTAYNDTSGSKGGETTSSSDIASRNAIDEELLADTDITGDIYEINDDYPSAESANDLSGASSDKDNSE